MTKKKSLLIVVSVVATICLLICILFVMQFSAIINILTKEDENPLQPEITYGEFPIKIEYLVNGEEIIIQDVLVCEFIEIVNINWIEKVSTGRSFERRWKSEFKNHEKQENIIELFKDDELLIDFSLGSANYYMGDIDINTTYPRFRVFKIQNNEEIFQKFISSPEELKEYGIEVVECVLPEPIKNSFS